MREDLGATYLSDNWTDKDQLDFGDFRPALYDILTTAQTPLTVGVFGPWGSGKTSLMRMLRQDIEQENLAAKRTVWFTAWKYDRQEALWRAFMLRVIHALYPRENEPADKPREERAVLALDEHASERQKKLVALLGKLEESVYQTAEWTEKGGWNIDWLSLVGHTGKAGVEVAATVQSAGIYPLIKQFLGGDDTPVDDLQKAAQAVSRETLNFQRRQLLFMEQFESTFREAVKLLSDDGRGRLVIFVDDLDRCLPEKAIEVLEAIKLFLEVEGVVFVLGMDQRVIRKGIEARYGALFSQAGVGEEELPIGGDSYLQKLVQIPFYLPALAVEAVGDYIKTQDAQMDEQTREVFARGLFPNPRQVKRALNIFRLLQQVALAREERGGLEAESIAWPLLAKTVVIQTQHPHLYQLWRSLPTVVQTLEEQYERLAVSPEDLFLGRRARPQPRPEAGEGEEPATEERRSGGLLDPYLADLQKYGRLREMLLYPKDPKETGAGRMRARFGGLSLEQVAAYVRLAGAAAAPEETVVAEVSGDLLADLISGDFTLVDAALAKLDQEEAEANGPLHRGAQEQLKAILADASNAISARASAGDALARLGDDRPGVGAVERDGVMLPDIAWGGEIPASNYTVGGDADARRAFEKKEIEISQPYQLARYPITNDQFQTFLDADDFDDPRWWEGMPDEARKVDKPDFPLANRPRVNVDWYQAVAFCRWLSDKLGERIDLPHEYEWEAAARYNDGRFYPWGNEFDPNKANTEESGLGQTSAVGIFPAGAHADLDLFDLSGNVWEWCGNKYDDPEDDAVDKGEDGRVVRGGSWNYDQYLALASLRSYGSHPAARYLDFGFRVVVRRPPSQNDP